MRIRETAPASGPTFARPRRAVEALEPGDSISLSPEAFRVLARKPARLGLGSEGPQVARLQRALLKWMPGWESRLEVDGLYGPRTAEAVRFFKRVYGLGRDGSSVDPATRLALRDLETGAFWLPTRPRLREMEARYRRALRTGYPLKAPDGSLTPAEIREIAAADPRRLVRHRGHEGQALMWKRFLVLEKAVAAEFPGHRLAITCTTGGEHSSAAHPEGRAVDFVLERVSDGYRPGGWEFDSGRLADLARDHGFAPFDEYVHDSAYKSGPHMHAEMSGEG